MSKILDTVVETIKLTERVDLLYVQMKELANNYKDDAKDLREKYHFVDKRIAIMEAMQ